MEWEEKTIMGARLTQRTGAGVSYIGNRTKFRGMPEMNRAGMLMVAAMREIMDKLADYEDTGMSPEQIMELKQANLRES
jgi:hypothetical protein